MKIAIISSASAGGAGIAASRVYQALNQHSGQNVDFLDLKALGHADLAVSPHQSVTNGLVSNTHFTTDYANGVRSWLIDFLEPYDYLNIHWCSYVLSIAEISVLVERGKKILFTLHDFYYLTGGCHYPAGCTGYKRNCNTCPQVDLQHYSYEDVMTARTLKGNIFSAKNVHLSAPSAHLVNAAIAADIIPASRGHVLRNPYQALEVIGKAEVVSKPALLLIADSFLEKRKGIELAIQALRYYCAKSPENAGRFELHVVGVCEQDIAELLADSGLKVISHGHIKEHDKLVHLFTRCQHLLSCSFEDNWPNILVEAGAYGCMPLVGPGHGCEEFCKTFDTGFVAADYSAAAFSKILQQAMENETTNSHRKKIRNQILATHQPEKIAADYMRIFSNIQNTNAPSNIKKTRPDIDFLIDQTHISENYLGVTSRELLASLDSTTETDSYLSVSLVATPFASVPVNGKPELVAMYSNATKLKFREYRVSQNIPLTLSEGAELSTIFPAGIPAFGLREFTISKLCP